MTVIETQTATEAAEYARELDAQIRVIANHAHVVLSALTELVREAQANNIHEALGYPSWTAYLADALDGQWKATLDHDKLSEAMQFLAAQGMSQRAIARVTGASKGAIHRELAGCPNLGQVIITGLDGKTYTRPKPQPLPEPRCPNVGHVEPDEESDEESQVDDEFIAQLMDIETRIDEREREVGLIWARLFADAFGWLDEMPPSCMKDVLHVGLNMRWRRGHALSHMEKGWTLQEVADEMSEPIELFEEILAMPDQPKDIDYIRRVLAFCKG